MLAFSFIFSCERRQSNNKKEKKYELVASIGVNNVCSQEAESRIKIKRATYSYKF